MKSRPRIIAAVVALAVFLGAAWAIFQAGRGPLPLDRSEFLRDVAEPITIADAMSFDDGGSMGLRFEDAQGAVKDICLQNSLAWEGDPKSDAGHHILVLNSFFPDGKRARRVPVSGGEERALLGLLERWASLDSDAQELEKRFEALERGELSSDDFWKDLPDQARLKEVAVSILRALRARN